MASPYQGWLGCLGVADLQAGQGLTWPRFTWELADSHRGAGGRRQLLQWDPWGLMGKR